MRYTLLIPAVLGLLYPQPKQALADLVIHDPLVGPTTATDNGVPVAVDPALTINISTRFLPDGSVSWSVFPSLPGPNNYGPVWIAAQEDGGTFCDFSGCTSGRFGWHNIGGPLDSNPDFGGLALGDRIGLQCVVTRDVSGTSLTIIDPPSLFDLLESYFAGDITIWELFDGIADALPQHGNLGRRKHAASNG
jgi:hypothetical protein